MSIFSPKTDVRPFMLADRLDGVYYQLARGVANGIENDTNRKVMGDKIHETVKRSIEDFVAFAVEFTIRNTLKAPEAEAVLKDMLILKMMTKTPSHDYYIQRFAGLDKDISRWRQAGQEYLMAGIAFGEVCGKTGNPEADNLIKQFGATVFAQVFEITKKELRRVRINL